MSSPFIIGNLVAVAAAYGPTRLHGPLLSHPKRQLHDKIAQLPHEKSPYVRMTYSSRNLLGTIAFPPETHHVDLLLTWPLEETINHIIPVLTVVLLSRAALWLSMRLSDLTADPGYAVPPTSRFRLIGHSG